ncbi:hypothetical protein FH972_022028 [Carpinus fangiana]|uniref:Uncharacterized protein n=1 Tax=Carpinus fangiana TaxID=176857 RepID=A0A5N6KR16_9ROSI|nr:hypothetical protein FH972_022028 [Carpinus fangiana]
MGKVDDEDVQREGGVVAGGERGDGGGDGLERCRGIQDHAGPDGGGMAVGLEAQGGNDAEAATGAAERPQEVWVGRGGGPEGPAGGKDDMGVEEVGAIGAQA